MTIISLFPVKNVQNHHVQVQYVIFIIRIVNVCLTYISYYFYKVLVG